MTKAQFIQYVNDFYPCVEDAEGFVDALIGLYPIDESGLRAFLESNYPCINVNDFVAWAVFDASGFFVGPKPHRPKP